MKVANEGPKRAESILRFRKAIATRNSWRSRRRMPIARLTWEKARSFLNFGIITQREAFTACRSALFLPVFHGIDLACGTAQIGLFAPFGAR